MADTRTEDMTEIAGAGGIADTDIIYGNRPGTDADYKIAGTSLKTYLSGLQLLATASASASASIDFTSFIDNTFEEYILKWINLVPATDGANLWFRTGNGGTFDSGASDYAVAYEKEDTSSGAGFASTSQSEILLNSAIGSASGEASCGEVHLWNPADSAAYTYVTHTGVGFRTTGSAQYLAGGSFRQEVAIVDRCQFLMSAGNIASGEFKLLGVKKS